MAKKPQPLALQSRCFSFIDHSLTKGCFCFLIAFDNEDCVTVVLIAPTTTGIAVCEHDELLGLDTILFHELPVDFKVCATTALRLIFYQLMSFVVCDSLVVVDLCVKAPQVDFEVLVLVHNAFDLGPLIASAGVVGVALGLGAQTLVRDILSGIFMLIEDQYGVGDSVDVLEIEGVVEKVGLRVTTVRDGQGTLWYLRNGEILKVGNQSQSG